MSSFNNKGKGPGGKDVSGGKKGPYYSQIGENDKTVKFKDKKFEGYSELKSTDKGSKGKEDSAALLALKQLEDEYILNLQKQIALMEQELKLLKEREAEQNKNANVYKVLLQEGIPVNADFIALKEKFGDQKESWENKLRNQSADNKAEIKGNKEKQHRIEILNHEFEVISDRYNYFKKETDARIEDLEHKIYTELNTIDKYTKEKEEISFKLIELEAENTQLERLIARNKMFNKKPDLMKERADELNKWYKKINELTEILASKDMELHNQIVKYEDPDLIKKQNETLLEATQKFNKIDIEVNIAKSQIRELEGIKKMNVRMLQDLYADIRDLEEDNRIMDLKMEPDAMDDAKFLEFLLLWEQKKKIELKSKIKADSIYAEHILVTLKDEEGKAKDMLDEKVRLENEMKLNQETLDKVKVSVRDNDADLIKFKSLHDLLETKKERFTKYVDDINIENNDYIKINAELELENEIIEKKIQMVLKKIDVNNLLKEVNVDDLALASKKNQIVNNVLMDLMNKWEQVNIQY